MITASIIYRDRVLERQYKKKGVVYKPNFQKEKNTLAKPKFYRGPILINLDYIIEKKGKGKDKKGKGKDRKNKKDKKDTKCFNYNKKGYQAKEYKQPKKEKKAETLNITTLNQTLIKLARGILETKSEIAFFNIEHQVLVTFREEEEEEEKESTNTDSEEKAFRIIDIAIYIQLIEQI